MGLSLSLGSLYLSPCIWLIRIRIYIMALLANNLYTMGNKINGQKNGDQFQKMVHQIQKDHSKKVSVHPDKKYLNTMIEHTISSKLPQKCKEMLLDTLHNKITAEELINTISVINSLKNTDFDSASFKTNASQVEKPESQFVFINFLTLAKKFMIKKKINPPSIPKQEKQSQKQSQPSTPTQSKSRSKSIEVDQGKVQQKLKILALILKKEINRIHHPFWKLNKIFAQYFINSFQQQLPTDKSQAYEKVISKIVNQWCIYLQQSCLSPYKKWITNYCQITQPKYKKWIHQLVMQQIWSVNNGYLYHMVSISINAKKIPLKIDIDLIQQQSALITPSLFQIDQKLQIEGHFFDSIYQMSEIQSHYRPQSLLNQLQNIKKRICTDIDNYHRLEKKGERYQIDSDNIIGIVSYILCKISNKIDQIYTHLIFLRIIYGDAVYFSMGVSSYMYSTIVGSLEFLQSEEFKTLLKEFNIKDIPIPNEKKESQSKEDTKCTSNKGQQTNHSQFWNEPQKSNQKLISSLLMTKGDASQ